MIQAQHISAVTREQLVERSRNGEEPGDAQAHIVFDMKRGQGTCPGSSLS
jgi:hypothetical protein